MPVPAVFKAPDIHIYDSLGEKEFAVINNEENYVAEWDYKQLNKDQFNENGSITFTIENWFFFIGSIWMKRSSKQKKFVVVDDYKNGTFIFRQESNRLRIFQFDISVVVLVKHTKNLNITYTSSVLSFAHKLIPKFTGETAIMKYCDIWFNETNEAVPITNLEDCPCTREAVRFDPDFISDPTCSSTSHKCHENIGATICYLKNINTTMYVSDFSPWLMFVIW